MAIDFSFPAWLRDQHSFADSLAKGAQVGAVIANSRYRNQALAAQAIQQEREFDLRERQLNAQEKTADMDYRLKSKLIEDQIADKETITGWIESVSNLPLSERINAPIPKNLRLAQSYGLINQIRDNDLDAFKATVQRDKGFAPGPLQKDMEYYQQVLSEGDPELIDLTRSILQSKAQKSGFSVKFGTGGTVESVDYGPQAKASTGTAPTVGFKTKLQEQLANDAGTVELLNFMQQNMTDADFGLRGVARDFKVRVGGQLGIDVEDEDLTVRKSIPLLRAALQKALKTDSNITEAERQDIKRALPSESWLESRKNADESLRVLVPWLRNRARRSAAELGIDAPTWAMTADEIREAYKANKLSEAEALEAIQKFNIPIPSP